MRHVCLLGFVYWVGITMGPSLVRYSSGQITAIAKTAMLEAQSLENMRAWSASGSKDIKYKTRALLLGSGKEKKL